MQNQQIKGGKRSRVWRNKATGEIVCGHTLCDAQGLGPFYSPTDPDWELVTRLEPADRVCIDSCGYVLPRNQYNAAVAAAATKAGTVTVRVGTRTFSQKVTYVGPTKVIYGE